MLIFRCTDCNGGIICADTEDLSQIINELDEHKAKCQLATFSFEGTTDVAEQSLMPYGR